MDGLEENKNKELGDIKVRLPQSGDKEFSPDYDGESADVSRGLSEGHDELLDPMNGNEEEADPNSENFEPAQNSKEEEKDESKEEKKEDKSESKASEHEGKYFVIQKGMCQCNQGFKFPKFKVTSHQKHYWNDAEGQADYLAVTEEDLTLDPPAMPFGNCKLQPSSSGYLPCTYAPVGKWQKPYEKVKVMGHSCLTEMSELMCAVGGKITVMKHGQQSEAGKSNAANANPQEQEIYNPVMDYEEFQEEVEESDNRHAW